MPNYHSISNYRGYSVKISPVSIWRRIFDWGYFSGGKVNLKVEFEFASDNENDKFGLFKTVVYLSHPPLAGTQPRQEWKARDDVPIIMNSDRINGVGEISVFLGENDRGIDERYCLFTANVIHPDIIKRDALIFVAGLVGSFIVGVLLWLLGFIEITPHARLFLR
jgi:hypothetical protein